MADKRYKRFCNRGHDTLVTGRLQHNHACVACEPIKAREHYVKAGLKKAYGVSKEQYDEMFNSQNGLCAICLKPELNRHLSVDHDHLTNKVRGLLCRKCNFILGFAADDLLILQSAMKYLRTYKLWP